jgi:hypothetical protein
MAAVVDPAAVTVTTIADGISLTADAAAANGVARDSADGPADHRAADPGPPAGDGRAGERAQDAAAYRAVSAGLIPLDLAGIVAAIRPFGAPTAIVRLSIANGRSSRHDGDAGESNKRAHLNVSDLAQGHRSLCRL